MKATFNFNVQIDGYKSVVTMDGQNIEKLEVDALVVLGKLFKDVQDRVNSALEKMYNKDKANKLAADNAAVDNTQQGQGEQEPEDSGDVPEAPAE